MNGGNARLTGKTGTMISFDMLRMTWRNGESETRGQVRSQNAEVKVKTVLS